MECPALLILTGSTRKLAALKHSCTEIQIKSVLLGGLERDENQFLDIPTEQSLADIAHYLLSRYQ